MILGIDTTTDACAVGLSSMEGMLADYRFIARYRHAERLPSAVIQVLEDTGTEPDALDGIAVSIGPGSFTGLRIGLAFAKGIAYGWEKPLLTVPTMDALLIRVPDTYDQVCILSSARKNEYYRGLFSRVESGWKPIHPVTIVKTADLQAGMPEGSLLFLGDGAEKQDDLSRFATDPRTLPEGLNVPSGSAVALLGERMLAEGDIADIGSASPLYMQRFQGVE